MDCSLFYFVDVWMRSICSHLHMCLFMCVPLVDIWSLLLSLSTVFSETGSLTGSLTDSGAHLIQLCWSSGICLPLTSLLLESQVFSWHVWLVWVLGSLGSRLSQQAIYTLSHLPSSLFLKNTLVLTFCVLAFAILASNPLDPCRSRSSLCLFRNVFSVDRVLG